MKTSGNYFIDRNNTNILKLREILAELPDFCADFFVGIESRTSILTRLNYAYDLRIFFDYLINGTSLFNKNNIKQISILDLDTVSAKHIERFLSYLNHYTFNGEVYTNGESGKARKLASLRSFFKYYYKSDMLRENVATKVDMPKVHDKGIIRLEADEVITFIDEAESGYDLTSRQQSFHVHTKERDTAIITLLLGTGMRVSECVGLNIDDIDFSVNGLKITRKGGNQVILYFGDEVLNALAVWLEKRREIDVNENEKALFLSLQKKRITVRAVQKLVKKYSSISTPLKHITPHKLRSTYGTSLYRETQDIYIVADVLGHKDVNTTKKHYAAMSDDIRRSVANKVKLKSDAFDTDNSLKRKK